ncbi:DUF3426 domain-containing protein [Reinekea blandensis]|uniref:Zinc finger/thioredoxin putative domain-containing protein n=1 Tax=Reinekea blandensis MED297 TaxID=314283 RepID=A4BFT7_9GAMM|nr:DUF3426 domain-containing protein [Reinekea blandensis]EAR08955.1 hypothetical protein MED297_03662 [Reinekea sp. MED297] [Reinekea blandensis MED297]
MAESFITRCPHCGTSFRVRNEQLSVANGSVRCGACLQVFSARNHVVTTSIPAQQPVKPGTQSKSPQTPKPAAKRPAQSAPKKASAAAKPKAPPPSPKPTQEDFRFVADDDDDAEFLFSDADDEDFIFDDNADSSLFDDDEDKDDGLGELSDSFLSLNSDSPSKRNTDHFQQESQALEEEFLDDPEENDESWAESMLEEIEKEDRISTRPKADFSQTQNHQENAFDLHAQAPQQRTQSRMQSEFERELNIGDFDTGSTASRVVNRASQEIELDFHMEERLHRLRPLGWLLIALLLVLLAIQVAWAFREPYARMDQWRGLYQTGCDLVGCTLPEQVDLESIRSSVLVRDHKDSQLNDVQMVDVVLTNRAPFKQPFPQIIMRYTDVNGQLVADQLLMPENYLKGEMTGVRLMPMNTRVYISFPIQRPPANAVNYQLVLQRNGG